MTMNKLLKENVIGSSLVVLGTVFLIAGVWFGLIKSQRGTFGKVYHRIAFRHRRR